MSDLEKRVAALEAVIKYGPIAAEFELFKQKEATKDAEKKAKEWPKDGDKYYYISDVGSIYSIMYDDFYEFHRLRKSIGNCFRTEKNAQDEIDRRELMIELQKFAKHENEKAEKLCEEYIIVKDSEGWYSVESCCGLKYMGQVWFLDSGSAWKAIKHFGERLEILFMKDKA